MQHILGTAPFHMWSRYWSTNWGHFCNPGFSSSLGVNRPAKSWLTENARLSLIFGCRFVEACLIGQLSQLKGEAQNRDSFPPFISFDYEIKTGLEINAGTIWHTLSHFKEETFFCLAKLNFRMTKKVLSLSTRRKSLFKWNSLCPIMRSECLTLPIWSPFLSQSLHWIRSGLSAEKPLKLPFFKKRLKHISGTFASLTWDSRTPCSTFWGQPLFTCEVDTEAQIGDTFATLDSPHPCE